nr:MAG TPA: hypothetical protein [Caudoviricetes sp.]
MGHIPRIISPVLRPGWSSHLLPGQLRYRFSK